MPVASASRWPGLAGLGLVWVLMSGCAPDFVEGSLGSLIDLHFDKTWIDNSSDEVGVRFSKSRGTNAGEDTVFQVTVRLDGVQLVENIEFDLTETISGGSQRGTVSRNVLNDPVQTFPAIKEGVFRLRDVPGASGSKVRGHFDLIFDNCIEFACGYTAFADFTGTVP